MRIILVRHGRPEKSDNKRVNSAGFANWVRNYNHSLVADDSRPITPLAADYGDYFTVSSDLPRAIHSSWVALNKYPDLQSDLFREMDIPRFKLPFTMGSWSWVYLNRALWMLGKKGRFESYLEARVRAKTAAMELIKIAQREERVIVFAHGYLNLHMRKHFRKKGFKQMTKSSDYWGVSIFET
ncbi:phosphoglycerate mutase family protein [Alteromonas sp. C1M14]|uniref:histidine phosphatase family protein n=1 Tax=Alteromonas sp. C1M14 TaxID=2841567 RepID=UPI001C09DC56|nr:phosphoglycerate mutase family protein [Alteromonas sp. C1M14]MBU2978750.1 histidine phosphatase family protein [Alteromonas sp. C1M14]